MPPPSTSTDDAYQRLAREEVPTGHFGGPRTSSKRELTDSDVKNNRDALAHAIYRRKERSS